MPYTHRKVGNKQCVFKKEDGSKVGCTSGPIQKYLAALHANANESVNSEMCNGFDFGLLGKPKITETNHLKGGKADKIQTLDELYKYWAKKGYANGGISKSLKKQLQYEISLGLKIEKEHTSDPDEQLEIVMDHLVEDKEYYTKSKPKNWADKEIDNEKINETSKILIKKLLRETLEEGFFNKMALAGALLATFASGLKAQPNKQQKDSTQNKIEMSQEDQVDNKIKEMIRNLKDGEMVGIGISQDPSTAETKATMDAKQKAIEYKRVPSEHTFKNTRILEKHHFQKNGKEIILIKITIN